MRLNKWRTVESKYIVKSRWLTLRADSCVTPEGVTVAPYYVLEYPDWAHIVALDPTNRVLITRQYRHGTGEICTEIPCGEIEPGEDPMAAARRELVEETGCAAESFELASCLFANPARQNNRVHCFLARGARQTEKPTPDASENIHCDFVSVPELLRMIDAGQLCQSLHVASVLTALRKSGLPCV